MKWEMLTRFYKTSKIDLLELKCINVKNAETSKNSSVVQKKKEMPSSFRKKPPKKKILGFHGYILFQMEAGMEMLKF